ncbi:hypothetical protein [Halalkalibacter krulwichiae]|uniref:hypothetical protein n=1 Tax=Halalkalibacter krulwichiae TaxID=199441 RepID=UPI000ABAE7F3|nr:hypothetical protein [Halalkalibacter krulwichiae]
MLITLAKDNFGADAMLLRSDFINKNSFILASFAFLFKKVSQIMPLNWPIE